MKRIIVFLVILFPLFASWFFRYKFNKKVEITEPNNVAAATITPRLSGLEPLVIKEGAVRGALTGKLVRIVGVASDTFRYPEDAPPPVEVLKERSLTAKEWGSNMVILYLNYPEKISKYVGSLVEFVDWAEKQELYVLINPVLHQADNNNYRQFSVTDDSLEKTLELIVEKLKNHDHVLYGTGAEPNTRTNDAMWHEKQLGLIENIRQKSPDSIIVVNGNFYGRNLEYYANNPFEYDNILYSLHYYVGDSDKDINFKKCSLPYGKDFPITFFVEEFGGVVQKDFGSKVDLQCIKYLSDEIVKNGLGIGMFTLDYVNGDYAGLGIMTKDNKKTPKGQILVEAADRLKRLPE